MSAPKRNLFFVLLKFDSLNTGCSIRALWIEKIRLQLNVHHHICAMRSPPRCRRGLFVAHNHLPTPTTTAAPSLSFALAFASSFARDSAHASARARGRASALKSIDAWDKETLAGPRRNHATAGEYAKAAKRSSKSQLAGKLRPVGSRVSKGGRKGDGYGTYAYHSAQNVRGVRALVAAAKVRLHSPVPVETYSALRSRTQIRSWRPSALSLGKWYSMYGQKHRRPESIGWDERA
jgi:hypothetical protein